MTQTIRKQFERHLARGRFFGKDDRVVVAVSTGVDSMALLDLLQHLPPSQRPLLLVAHVNHELRAQSAEEEEYLRDYCQRRGLPLAVAHWPKGEHPQQGIEEAARHFRYAFFERLMVRQHAKVVLTAHHANDLAETMLMKLARGGQLSQLLGIRDQRPFGPGRLVRPLLPFTKQDLYQYARARHLKWFEDATNRELTVARNRFRHQILPALEKENPQLVPHLLDYRAQLAELLKWRDRELSRQLVPMLKNKHLQLVPLLRLDRDRQLDLLRYWLEQQGVVDLKADLLAQLQQLLANEQKPQAQFTLPGTTVLVKEYRECWLKNINKMPAHEQKAPAYMVKLGQRYPINDHQCLLVSADRQQFAAYDQAMPMWLAPAQLPLTLRPWRRDDRLQLRGGQHQRVQRVLIDQKVPTVDRKHQLALVDAQGTVVWLLGRKWSWFDRPAGYRQRWRQLFIGIKSKEEKTHE